MGLPAARSRFGARYRAARNAGAGGFSSPYIRDGRVARARLAASRTARSVPGERQIVGDENQAESFTSLQLFEENDDFGFGVLVEVARRLVGEQQARRVDQRTGNRHPALLAAGQACRIGGGAAGQTDPRQADVRRAHRLARLHRAGRAEPEQRRCRPRVKFDSRLGN